MDLWHIYTHMFRSRLFEEAVARAWQAGRIMGEMHSSIGEEAIAAATVLQLKEGDAMLLDHRGTAPLVIRGVDMALLYREFLGHPDGLCGGKGGHMHLFSRPHLAASSGIVGATGPLAAGFALAAKRLRPGNVALAYFGDGAMNQGMLLESFNLAAAWKLPVLFICKDSHWAITTETEQVTGGNLIERVRGFGIPAEYAEGWDVERLWPLVQKALVHIRDGKGPFFIHATCVHLEGHFLGDPLIRVFRHPLKEARKLTSPLLAALSLKSSDSVSHRKERLEYLLKTIGKAAKQRREDDKDPVKRLRKKLLAENKNRLKEVEQQIRTEIDHIISQVERYEKEAKR